jgi:hypothetical protein
MNVPANPFGDVPASFHVPSGERPFARNFGAEGVQQCRAHDGKRTKLARNGLRYRCRVSAGGD